MTSSTGRRKARGEGHTRREEILDAAKALILEEGMERATIRSIAARLGVSSTALYLYFPDRDAIMLELCDRAFAALVQRFAAIAAEEAEPLRALKRMMETYVRFGLDHPDEYRLIFMVKQAIPVGSDPQADALSDGPGTLGAKAFIGLRDVVARLVADGVLVRDDPVKVAQMIWMAGHGMVSLLITMPYFPWAEREELIRSHIDMPLRGLLAARGA